MHEREGVRGGMRWLFICTGNVCRSVMAELMAERLAAERRLQLEARSCGVAAELHFPTPPEVWECLAPLGIAPRPRRPQLVSRELLSWCDAAFVMTARHREAVIDAYPEHRRKVFVLRARAGLALPDIEDPIGRPAADYAACRDSIQQALEVLLQGLPTPE